MARIQIRPATADDVTFLAPRLRAADRFEVLASTGLDPARSLQLAFELSDQVWTGTADGVPGAMFGVSSMDPLTGAGVPWLLGSDLVEENAIAFLRASRRIVDGMRQEYTLLENYVDARNVASIGWLQWLGFDIHEQAPFGPFGVPFHRFTWGGA